MKLINLTILATSLSVGMAMAEVQVEGPIEYGVFVSAPIQDPQPGERILSRANQPIEQTDLVPARLGTKFGVRYRLTGKIEGEQPLTLLYFTPGLVGGDGKRQDKIELQQKLVPGALHDVMAFEFTEHHEVVPGRWQFMVFQGERKLLEQHFQVK